MLAGQMSLPVRVARAIRVVGATLCLFVHGCADVNGGAVELSWKLRASTGATTDFLSCDDRCDGGTPGAGLVTRIRLDWQVGAATGSRSWCCRDGHGVTGFELPPGSALLSVTPICATGPADTGTYTAPAPEQRAVIVGDTVSLGAIELVLQTATPQDAECVAHKCICQ
jgi:hypothetical protein